MENEIAVSQELIPVEKINVPQLFTSRQMVEQLLAAIEAKAKEHVPDLETASGRKEIASNAYKVAQSKTFLDNIGKDFVAVRKAEIKVSDDLRKLIRDTLDNLKDEVRKPLTDYEEAEKARAEKEEAERKFYSDWDEALAEDELFNRKRDVERREAELARIEAERKAKEESERAERERIEREKRIAQEAAERAKREAEEAAERKRIEAEQALKREREEAARKEREANEAAERAERERIAAIERAKIEKEMAVREAERKAREQADRKERERIAKEKAEQAEKERIARNKAHQKQINNAALVCFEQNGIDAETAKAVIKLIASGKIDYITINY